MDDTINMLKLYSWLLVLAAIQSSFFVTTSFAAKLLLVTQFYHSHAHVLAGVGDELHQRGHQVVMVAASVIRFLNDKPYTVKYYQTVMEQKDLDDCLVVVLKSKDFTMSPCVKFIREDLIAFSTNKKLLQELKDENFGIQLYQYCYLCYARLLDC